MEWLDSLVGALGGGLLSIAGSIVYFRPKLKEAKAEAKKAETEASAMEYSHLLDRIKNMEELYAKQGEIIDTLRKQVLELGQEKLERDKEIQSLRAENKENKQLIEKLTQEVDSYKKIIKDKI